MSQKEFFGSDREHSRADRAFGTRKCEPIEAIVADVSMFLKGIAKI
jgi:hypothetical protein